MLLVEKQLKRFQQLFLQLEYKQEEVCPLHLDHDSLQLMLKEDRASFIHHYKNEVRTWIYLLQSWQHYFNQSEWEIQMQTIKNIPDNDPVSIFLAMEQIISNGVIKRYQGNSIQNIDLSKMKEV